MKLIMAWYAKSQEIAAACGHEQEHIQELKKQINAVLAQDAHKVLFNMSKTPFLFDWFNWLVI
jgi:hypothetical protein